MGTQTSGDYWTWSTTTSPSGAETFTAANEFTGYTYSGTAAALAGNAAGFTKLTYTGSSDPGVPAGATAYQIEIPGTAVMAVPAPFTTLSNGDNIPYSGSNNPPVVAIAQGTCPTSGGTFSWILVPFEGWCSGDDPSVGQAGCPAGSSYHHAYGTATITVSNGSYDVTIYPYFLSGTPDTSHQSTITGATCSNGVISGTDSRGQTQNLSFTPSGMFFNDLPRGSGSVVGADASTTVDFTDLLQSGRVFAGWNFMSIRQFGPDQYTPSPYTAPMTEPVRATTDGSTINGLPFTDLDSGTLESNPGTGAALTLVSQPSPGLIRAQQVTGSGTQDVVLIVKKIEGKYYVFTVTDHWNGSHAGSDEMTGKNTLVIER